MSGYAPEAAFAPSREAFAQAEQWLAGAGAAGLDHAALEKELQVRGREIQRRLLQAHLDLRAAREQRRAQVTGPDGICRRRAEAGHARPLSSVLGPVRVTRIAYRAPGARNVHLADAELNLPPGRHSHELSEMVAAAAARGSFAQACAGITGQTGCPLGTRQCQQLARAAAAGFGDFYASRRRPRPAPRPAPCWCWNVTARASRCGPGSCARGQRGWPARPSRSRTGGCPAARSAPASGWPRSPRSPASPRSRAPRPRILAPGPRPPCPQAAGKWLTASIAADAADVVAAAFAGADRRDPRRERTWIALADGNKDQIRWIRAQAAARGITITILIDVIHVTEYLWDAAWCFFPEASSEAGPWVRDRAAAILDGHALQVAAALRGAAATSQLSAAKRKAAVRTARYLETKAPWLDYPTALAAGWPISTGVIEGACRHLVADRMGITGARWGVQTAEAILQLRALHANGDFDAYWAYHLQRERQRNHPASYTLAA